MIHHDSGIPDIRSEPPGIIQIFRQNSFFVQRFCTINFCDDFVFAVDLSRQLLCKLVIVHHIAHTDACAVHFIHIAGTDSFVGGSHFISAF